MSFKDLQLKLISLLRQLIHLQQTLLIKKLKKIPWSYNRTRLLISLIANQEKVDPDVAVAVAHCESSLMPGAKSTTGGYGLDRGLYQWNEYFHPEISDRCAYDPECATRAFCRAVRSGHLAWWTPSRACWSKRF